MLFKRHVQGAFFDSNCVEMGVEAVKDQIFFSFVVTDLTVKLKYSAKVQNSWKLCFSCMKI